MSKRILIVDRDAALRQSLEEQFQLHETYQAIGVDDAREAATHLGIENADFLILDAEAAQDEELMRIADEMPFLLLLEKEQLSLFDGDEVDFLAKPIRFSELLYRLRAFLRQSEVNERAMRLAHFMFRPGAKLLLDEDGEKTYLTEKETSILRFLHEAGEVVSRELLLSEVWGYNSGVTTHTLETHIYRLRQKIEKDPSNAEILLTEAGGYRLVP